MSDHGDPEPDTEEKAIRFGCGALLGILFGFYLAFRFTVLSFGMAAAVVLGVVVLCGYLALRYGDDFWHWILSNVR
jgi:hypothetical protein